MSVVAKFRVNGVEHNLPETDYIDRDGVKRRGPVRVGEEGKAVEAQSKVRLSAVYVGDESEEKASDEDIRFSKATPYGNIEFTCTNPEALEQFQVNDTFYVHFVRAES